MAVWNQPRSFWTWGNVSDEPSEADRQKMARQVGERLGREVIPPPIPDLDDVELQGRVLMEKGGGAESKRLKIGTGYQSTFCIFLCCVFYLTVSKNLLFQSPQIILHIAFTCSAIKFHSIRVSYFRTLHRCDRL